MNISDYMKILKKYKNKLSKQQFQTFKGLILKGEYYSFIKGLRRIINETGE